MWCFSLERCSHFNASACFPLCKRSTETSSFLLSDTKCTGTFAISWAEHHPRSFWLVQWNTKKLQHFLPKYGKNDNGFIQTFLLHWHTTLTKFVDTVGPAVWNYSQLNLQVCVFSMFPAEWSEIWIALLFGHNIHIIRCLMTDYYRLNIIKLSININSLLKHIIWSKNVDFWCWFWFQLLSILNPN